MISNSDDLLRWGKRELFKMTTFRRVTLAIAALTLSATVLAGCSSNDDYPLLFGNGGSPAVQASGGNVGFGNVGSGGNVGFGNGGAR
jgi:hypothetical protein